MFKKKITTMPRVAILGSRGIPSGYGGFETMIEAISERLAIFGCAVTVYCRTNYFIEQPKIYKGVRLIYIRTIKQKFLDTPWHTFKSVLHAIFTNKAKVIIMVNVGNAPFALLAKIFGKKVIFCVDGLDWERKKWGFVARTYLRTCSVFARLVSSVIVTDAESVRAFYKQKRHLDTVHIPYGTDFDTSAIGADFLKEYGVEAKRYFIYVARFEPENNPLLVVEAYVKSGSKLPLLMIGDNRYNRKYVAQVKAAAGASNVLFLGYVFGARYKQLLKNALAYIRAAEVGGLSPAVIEAMGRGVCVVANDKSENRESLGDTGIFYNLNADHLSKKIHELSARPELAEQLGGKASVRAMIFYGWDKIAHDFFKLISGFDRPSIVEHNVPLGLERTMRKKILITGAGGMLGSAMYEHFSKKYKVLATSLHATDSWMVAMDVCDSVQYEKTVAKFRPDYILHLPAITDLEWCEKHLSEAYAINVLAVKQAGGIANRYGAKLVYISSSNVFSGEKRYYTDNDEPSPINVYGLTKQAGAMMAEYYARDYLILRLGWLMGGGQYKDTKFVSKILQQIASGKKELHALTDKIGSISYARDVAGNLEKLLEADARGTYNMASLGFATRYDVARKIVEILGYANQVKVTPVTSDFFSGTFTTPRLASECLLNERLMAENLSIMRPWEEALEDYLEKDFSFAFNIRPMANNISQPAFNPV